MNKTLKFAGFFSSNCYTEHHYVMLEKSETKKIGQSYAFYVHSNIK